MDPLNTYEFSKLQMAERHAAAARARMAGGGRSLPAADEHETSVRRRWTPRQVVGRIGLGRVGA
jgi:hypothetical protein